MKAEICLVIDFDHEVIDVELRIQEGTSRTRYVWIRGFEETEYQLAELYGQELAKVLSIEYVGEVVDA